MNLHINGIEMPTVELTIEYVRARRFKGERIRAHFRATVRGDRAYHQGQWDMATRIESLKKVKDTHNKHKGGKDE